MKVNAAGFRQSDAFTQNEISPLNTAFADALKIHTARLNARAWARQVRRCHGDLHLRNICLFEGRVRLFDCLEFNDAPSVVGASAATLCQVQKRFPRAYLKGGNTQRYVCHGTFGNNTRPICIAFGSIRIDRAVATDVLDRLQPLGIEAALSAVIAHEEKQHDKLLQMENALQQARFEAKRAQCRYDAVDPDNRLVAEELERRWNDTLHQVRDLEIDIDRLKAKTSVTVSMPDRERFVRLEFFTRTRMIRDR